MQRVDAAIADQRQHERQVLAEVIVGVLAGQPLDHGRAGIAARGAQPEGGVAAQLARLAGRDELGERGSAAGRPCSASAGSACSRGRVLLARRSAAGAPSRTSCGQQRDALRRRDPDSQ